MFCKSCGAELKDGALFCTRCGTPAGSAAPSAPEVPGPTNGSIADQVTAIRSQGRRRIPFVLLVVLIVLALSAVAFAAYMAYTHLIAPQPPQTQEQPTASTENTAQQTPTSTAESIYDGIISLYGQAQNSSWSLPESSYSSSAAATDLSQLQRIMSGEANAALGTSVGIETLSATSSAVKRVDVSELSACTFSYAYADLGNNGTPDLIIGATKSDGTYYVLGMFSTDGTNAIALDDGIFDDTSSSWWILGSDGSIWRYRSRGGEYYLFDTYSIDGSSLVLQHEYADEGLAYKKDGASTTDTVVEEAGTEMRTLPRLPLDWHPLGDFTGSSPAAATSTAATPSLGRWYSDGYCGFNVPPVWEGVVTWSAEGHTSGVWHEDFHLTGDFNATVFRIDGMKGSPGITTQVDRDALAELAKKNGGNAAKSIWRTEHGLSNTDGFSSSQQDTLLLVTTNGTLTRAQVAAMDSEDDAVAAGEAACKEFYAAVLIPTIVEY